jgi:pimeloyl-ACP methyl ester carboxylesterase
MNPDAPPPFRLLVGELRVARTWIRARLRPEAAVFEPVGNGAPVMTLPGFCAGDISMAQMRRNLNAAGFRAKRWKQGANLGARPDSFERLRARVDYIADREGRPVHLIGWSLGGIFAREFAKYHPDHVASVITMGSPFSGSRRANNAWRLYELIARHSVDDPPVPFHPDPKPPVPTYALWSARDGVSAPDSAAGLDHERDRAIELDCVHMGFAFAPEVTRVVVECLCEAEHLFTQRNSPALLTDQSSPSPL